MCLWTIADWQSVDCHDGDDEPEVFHKKTLTSKCPVREICHAINKYAFVTSPYPVIISAEVHCSSEQQERLGAILRGVFGEKLVTAPLPGCVGLPSPEDLKYRILFKVSPGVIAPVPITGLIDVANRRNLLHKRKRRNPNYPPPTHPPLNQTPDSLDWPKD